MLESLLESMRSAVQFDAAGVFVLNRSVKLGQDSGGRMIAGMAVVGFDETPRDEDPMLRRGQGIIGHVIATGQTVIAPDVRRDPHYVQGRAGTLSEIAVPIVSGGTVVGALNLESDTVDAFAEADVESLEFFAVAAAISIEKAVVHLELLEKHRIEQQLRIAKDVQSALLPAADPSLPGYDIAGINLPSWEIGGDYFDFLPQPDGRLGIAIADVSGKGVAAALIMATFRAALRAQRVGGVPLDAVAGRLNRLLLDSMDASRFVTAFYGLLEPATGQLDFANCGHNPPLLLHAAGLRDLLPGGGPALGMWPGAAFAPGAASVLPGDTLVLYTDGVIEVMNAAGEMFGVDRLEHVIRRRSHDSSQGLVDAVVDATRAFSGRPVYEDDFTLVIIRREAGVVGRRRMSGALVLALLLAVLIGVSLGTLGSGGSIITMPVLVYVAGIPAHTPSACRSSSSGRPPPSGAPSNRAAQGLDARAAAIFAATGAAGAFAGARLTRLVSGDALMAIFAALMLIAGWRMLAGAAPAAASRPCSVPRCAARGPGARRADRLPRHRRGIPHRARAGPRGGPRHEARRADLARHHRLQRGRRPRRPASRRRLRLDADRGVPGIRPGRHARRVDDHQPCLRREPPPGVRVGRDRAWRGHPGVPGPVARGPRARVIS